MVSSSVAAGVEVQLDNEEAIQILANDQDVLSTSDDPESLRATSEDQNLIFGENGCPAYARPDSACVDFFFSIVPDSRPFTLTEKLERAFAESEDICLKLILNLGCVRKAKDGGGGKMDRENFFRSLLWVWQEHPQVFLEKMLRKIPDVGSLQCLLEVFLFAVHDTVGSPEVLLYDIDSQMAIRRRQQRSSRRGSSDRGKTRRGRYTDALTKKAKRTAERAGRLARWRRFRDWLLETQQEWLAQQGIHDRWRVFFSALQRFFTRSKNESVLKNGCSIKNEY